MLFSTRRKPGPTISRRGADKYCTTVMETLQQQLGKLGNDVQAGLNVLYDRQREASTHVPHLDANDYPES